jgi:hypothetical protein
MRAVLSLSLLLAISCNGDKDSPVDSGSPAPDDTGDTGDTDVPTEEPSGDWTEGPELASCSPHEGSDGTVALSGVLLTPEGAQAGTVVYDPADGRISCVGDCDTDSSELICTQGVISPGLIDTHNHLQYNVIPPWEHDALFADRYDWRSDGDYWDYRTAYDEIEDDYGCEIMKWAELRVLVGGGTSAVGSYGSDCIHLLVRNLDEDEYEHGLSDYSLYYSSGTVDDSYDESDGSYYREELESGDIDAFLNHVAEGVDGEVSYEIDHMFDVGMDGPGQGFVHATDASAAQLAQMAESGTTMVWSPRSNLDLYAQTSPADIARTLGVPVAIGPDWTWSGSLNPARELECAHQYLDTRVDGLVDDVWLWEMATQDAARAVGLDGVLGSLEVGMKADISVFTWHIEPYRSVIQAGPEDVLLVIVDGQALYGTAELMEPVASNPDWCETVTPCSEARTLCVQADSSGDDSQTYEELESLLSGLLEAVEMPDGFDYSAALHGLWMCEDTRESCDLSDPTEGDEDGDGFSDEEDLCPLSWDPAQADHDEDGLGDACDLCPLWAGSDECEHTLGDIDDDGIATEDDTCPYLHNEEQIDTDGDGIGDECDACPEEFNADGAGCSYTIAQLRNPEEEGHPEEGTAVTLVDVVVTGIKEAGGFFIQDPGASEYGGIYVYDNGDGVVEVGDVVTVSGSYLEYYDLSEVAYATTTVTGSWGDFDAIAIADPCSVGTEGELAELYESMLLTVENLTTTDANPDGESDYGEFEVNDCLRVDDQLWDGLVEERAVDMHYTAMTGILGYTYSNFKLLPRSEEDVSP